ncbi:hypothetical protein BAT02nite_40220 [Bacillus atrophaeus]|nr:hypothetical protein BAT02nite_40220 [Bacillus atrophaeus]
MHTAMANPSKIVPANREPIPASDRNKIPTVNKNNDDINTSSVPNRRDSIGTKGERNAKASKGTVVNVPASAFDIPKLSRIDAIKGPTDVKGALRFAPIKMIPIVSNNIFFL